MPFKNIEAKREYQRQLMAQRRAKQKGLTNVSPGLVSPDVRPQMTLLDPTKSAPVVSPNSGTLNPVSSKVKMLDPQLLNYEPITTEPKSPIAEGVLIQALKKPSMPIVPRKRNTTPLLTNTSTNA